MDRLPGIPYSLSFGLLWLQLSIPGTGKVMCVHVCMCGCPILYVCTHKSEEERGKEGGLR